MWALVAFPTGDWRNKVRPPGTLKCGAARVKLSWLIGAWIANDFAPLQIPPVTAPTYSPDLVAASRSTYPSAAKLFAAIQSSKAFDKRDKA